MAITKDRGRQFELTAKMEFAFGDMVDDTYVSMIDLPAGAVVTGGGVAITTLFDSATDDKFSIGDKEGAAAADKTEYAALSADVTAAPTWIPIVPNGKQYAEAGSVGVVWNGTGTAPTAGAGVLIVKYMISNRTNEVQAPTA